MNLKHIFLCSKSCEEYNISKDAKELSRKNGSRTLQISSAINASLMLLGCGAAELWASPALAHFKSDKSAWRLTINQSSWLASVFNAGGVIGYLLYPLLIDRAGRKYTLLILLFLQVASYVMTYFAKNLALLYSARILSGIGYNASMIVAIIYIGEIAGKNIRGFLVALAANFYIIGNLLVVTLGAFLSYDNMNLTLLVTSFLFLIYFPIMPESPYYYLHHNRDRDAMESLSRLRGKDLKSLEEEILKMKEILIEGQQHKSFGSLFMNKRYRKALLIVLLVKTSLVLSGTTVISLYSQEIFRHSGIALAPEYATIILIFVRCIVAITVSPLFDSCGRRILTLFSGILCALSLGIVGWFFWKLGKVDLSSVSWLPLVALTVAKVSSAGLYNAGMVLTSEVFPNSIKSSAVSFLNIKKELLMFLVNFVFERSVSEFGIYSVFWMFAISSFSLSFVGFCIMPETKGKTLEEIQKLFL